MANASATQPYKTSEKETEMMQRIITIACAALIALVGVAVAENSHSYNGGYCKAFFGSDTGDLSAQGQGMFNPTLSTRLITCPVLVDEISNTTGTTKVWLHWKAGAAFPNDTIRCTLMSRNGNGSPRQAKAGSRTGSGWFSIPNITSDDFWGSYTMTCQLPRMATLNTIWIGEQN